MVFSLLSIPSIVSAAVFLCMGILVFRQNPRLGINRSFLYFCLTIFLWQVCWAVLFNTKNEVLALLIMKLGYSFALLIPIALYQFNIFFLELQAKEAKIILFLHFVCLLFLVPLWSSNTFIDGVIHQSWGYYPKAGFPYHPIYLLFLAYLVLWPNFLILKAMRQPFLEKINRHQLRFLFAADLVFAFSAIDFAPSYGLLSTFPLGVIPINLSLAIIIFSILRYKLMDFSLLTRWELAYSIIVLLTTVSLAMFTYAFEKVSQNFLNIWVGFTTLVIACIFTLLIDPLRKRINRNADEIIFQSPDFQIVLKGIEDAIKETSNITDLSSRLSEKFKKIWATEHSGFAIWNFQNSYFQLFPEQEFLNNSVSKLHEQIGRTDFLVRTLESERRLFWNGVILEEEVTNYGNKAFPGEKITFWKIRRTMQWLGATVCIPLMWKKELIGFIILGPKKNHSTYNDEDKKFILHLAEKVSLALNNLLTTKNAFGGTQPQTY